jgi:hypothetical protein
MEKSILSLSNSSGKANKIINCVHKNIATNTYLLNSLSRIYLIIFLRLWMIYSEPVKFVSCNYIFFAMSSNHSNKTHHCSHYFLKENRISRMIDCIDELRG